MGGDEPVAVSVVVNGGLRADSKFPFDLGIRIDLKNEFVGILVAIKGENELRIGDVGNFSGHRRWFWSNMNGPGVQRYRNGPEPNGKEKQQQVSRFRKSSAKTHDGTGLRVHGFRLGITSRARN